MNTQPSIAIDSMDAVVEDVLAATSFIDIHTHLFTPSLGSLGLWGIDEVLTYHYLEAELFRFSPVTPEHYWTLTKTQRADLVWKTLFVENTPLSEAARGVIFVLSALKLDTDSKTLAPLREYFRSQKLAEYIPLVFRLAGITHAVMTNDPLDPEEAAMWMRGIETDSHFPAVMRIDRILNQWSAHHEALAVQGYAVDSHGGGTSMKEVRRFLADWVARMKPVYMAVSLEDTFNFPEDDVRTKLFREAVLPTCREFHLPMSLMIGVRRQINPALRLAGDGVGRTEMRAVQNIALEFPDNRFLDQHAEPRESARTLRHCAEVPKPAAVRLLVVSEQHVDCGRDDTRTAGNAGHELHPAALRCTHSGAGHLQVAQYAPHCRANSFAVLQIAGLRRPMRHSRRYPTRCESPVPYQL